MDQPPEPANSSPGLRTLAAIIFTDVVGFSARMQKDEVATLKLLQRDFAEMRRMCKEHGGTVLKTTGDGLLLTFSSAVHAVACALEMQRQFAEVTKAKPNALQHRLGIHLGDILFQNQDVMGDGVNIASRLQAEAEPGGICISQTVYDVVKNKLEMQAVSLGPRELKNITQAVPVYRILLEATALAAVSSRSPVPVEPNARAAAVAAGAPSASRGPFGAWIAAGLFVAAVAGVGIFYFMRSAPPVAPAPAPAAPTATQASTAPAAKAAAETEVGMTDEEFEKELARRQAQTQQIRAQYLEKYDFVGFTKALKESGDSPQGKASTENLIRSAELMTAMKDWLEFSLARYRVQQQLPVADLSGDATKDFRVFPVIGNKLVIVENNAPTPPRAMSELKPPVVGAIIVSALRISRNPPPTRDQILGAQAFARFFNLPQMLEAVNPMLLRGNQARQGQGQVPGVPPNAARQGQAQGPNQANPARQGQNRAGRAAP